MSVTAVSVAMVQPALKVTAATRQTLAPAKSVAMTGVGGSVALAKLTTTSAMPEYVRVSQYAMERTVGMTDAKVRVVPAPNNMSASKMGHASVYLAALEKSVGQTAAKVPVAPVPASRKFATVDNVNASHHVMARSVETMDVVDLAGSATRGQHAYLTTA
jgi:hypothetical protein